MDAAERKLIKLLQQKGCNITNPRIAVFRTLLERHPASVQEILAILKDDVDRATVYRVLQLYERLGVVERLYIGWKYRYELSDIFHHHHHHLTCMKCSKVVSVSEDLVLEQEIARLSYIHKFKAIDHQLEIRGLCRPCQ